MRHSFPDFATVLKEAEAERDSAEHLPRPTVNLASAVFSAGFNPASNGTYPTEKIVPQFDLQDFESDQDKLDREMQELAKRMESQSPASIRRELNLRPEMKRAELQRLRRQFAAQNHPDRLPQEFRLAAEQRMKTANALLDSAMTSATNEL
ncbi:hypothetical protein [Brucella pituitosa]|uniref:Uncharacterized protein n=1 Tax=Brucella pituitosa TaxID=571256 RepID=A0A643F4U2_9HYPH|nr:hypothetical protein [Brucella pituitosa]KAB0572484.1 hypothetical protein F7Q93_06580 [Brucella pituitosa]